MGPSRLTDTDQCKIHFIALVERYCQLGRLLPALDDIDTDDGSIAMPKTAVRLPFWRTNVRTMHPANTIAVHRRQGRPVRLD